MQKVDGNEILGEITLNVDKCIYDEESNDLRE